MAPQSGHPSSWASAHSTTRRPPSGRSTASTTRNPGRLKIKLAASRCKDASRLALRHDHAQLRRAGLASPLPADSSLGFFRRFDFSHDCIGRLVTIRVTACNLSYELRPRHVGRARRPAPGCLVGLAFRSCVPRGCRLESRTRCDPGAQQMALQRIRALGSRCLRGMGSVRRRPGDIKKEPDRRVLLRAPECLLAQRRSGPDSLCTAVRSSCCLKRERHRNDLGTDRALDVQELSVPQHRLDPDVCAHADGCDRDLTTLQGFAERSARPAIDASILLVEGGESGQ